MTSPPIIPAPQWPPATVTTPPILPSSLEIGDVITCVANGVEKYKARIKRVRSDRAITEAGLALLDRDATTLAIKIVCRGSEND